MLKVPFLALSNANIEFAKKKLTWKSYITTKTLPTTKQVESIDRKRFVKVALDENFETFVVHIVALETSGITIYLS